jgi:uncharacterized protein HemY
VNDVVSLLGLALLILTGVAMVLGLAIVVVWELRWIVRHIAKIGEHEESTVWFPEVGGRRLVKSPFKW